jgi:hypothetical protein
MSLEQPLQTTNVLQPTGVHASNDLESLPQPHFCIEYFGLKDNICMYVSESPKRVSDVPDFLTSHKKVIFQNGWKRHSLREGLNNCVSSPTIILLILIYKPGKISNYGVVPPI